MPEIIRIADTAIPYRKRSVTRYIILHDSHTADQPLHTAEDWLRWRGRQMGLLDIGYHFLVGQDGLIAETRPRDTVGSHAGGYNHNSIGVCLIGGEKHVDHFSGWQMRAFYSLAYDLSQQFPNPEGGPLEIVAHTELQRYTGRNRNNPCPCCDMRLVRSQFSTYKDEINAFVAEHTSQPATPTAD